MVGFRVTERSVLKYVSTVTQEDSHLQTTPADKIGAGIYKG